ncbi:SMAD/FHA domain-containing protein [Auricularia subglabra TFB-10046 SS5]|nr:SMAD/FHA domain-containing protein [Auricularia subglabra TFB-10046 SS5]
MAQDDRAAAASPAPVLAAGAPMANASALIGGGGGNGQRSRPRPTSTMAINHAVPAPPPPPPSAGAGSARRIRLVPHLENARSLHWDAITRDVRPGDVPLRIGRFTDRNAGAAVTHSNNKLAFRSKVVSRGHAEIWLEGDKFYIRDTKSSSGTFLNHIRLAPPNTESRPVALKDGDILQLGVDYQGGTEEIYRCVKMRIEVGREWQNSANAFNQNALAQLRALSNPNSRPPTATAAATKPGGTELAKSASAPAPNGTTTTNPHSTGDCCICLFAVTVCQALFIAPCSHAFHYKCIRPLLTMHHPGFNCPLCRTFADLNADVEVDLPPPAPEVEAPQPVVVDLTMADEEEDGDGDVAMNMARSTTLRRNRSAPNLADETDAEGNPPPTAAAHTLRMPMAVAESDAEPDELAGGTINAHSRGPSASAAVSRSTLMLPPPPPTPGGVEAGATLIPGMSFASFAVPGPSSARERERDDEMEVEIEMAVDEEGSEREGSGEGVEGDGEGSGESGRSGSKRRRR